MTLGFECNVAGMTIDDVSVRTDPPLTEAPIVTGMNIDGANVTVHFDRPIPSGAWTCLRCGGPVQEGEFCIASLPGDVDGDRYAEASDILYLIDCLNGVSSCEAWQCDIDRSGVCGPPDILREIDLLNGAAVYEQWLNRSLPMCPMIE